MKNAVLFFLAILGITSCSKDSLDIGLDLADQPEKSEIIVRVSYLVWTSDQCEPGCGGSNKQESIPMANANIYVYQGDNIIHDHVIDPVHNSRTSADGSVQCEHMEPGIYTVMVETPLGEKSRTITTQLHRRSFIDFSF